MRRARPTVARASRTTLTLTLVLVMLLVVGLIGASPLALNGFRGAKEHWERLSFIGQTYGAASAILSVLALIGACLGLGAAGVIGALTERLRVRTR
jgi:hypothetical protein